MKYLNVAEKNDAAKNIAAILSRGASQRVGQKKHQSKSLYFLIFSEKASPRTIKFTNSTRRFSVNNLEW
jgi:hypothetical protein